MPEEQFKRNIAYKFRVGDLLVCKQIFDGEKFLYLELGDKKIIRVNIAGNIVDRYESEGEKEYIFLTIDDGSGQIKLRIFGEDVEKFRGITPGQTVIVIGTLRNFNNETYILPEIIREQDPKYLLVRKLELEKQKNQFSSKSFNKQEARAMKDKILDIIKNAEQDGGIEVDKIIMELREISSDAINQEIRKLLEEGIIFEPRPGKLRWLG